MQLLLIERINEILSKCAHNAFQISESLVSLNVNRLNNEVIQFYRKQTQETIFEGQPKSSSSGKLKSWAQNQDIVFLLIFLGLKIMTAE
jgi:hypothetical protein